MKLAIVVGHYALRPGARGRLPANQHGHAVEGMTEYAANAQLAAQMVERGPMVGIEARAFRHVARTSAGQLIDPTSPRPSGSPSYAATVRPTIAEVNEWAPDAVVELHFNSVPREHGAWPWSFAYHFPGSRNGQRLGAGMAAACAEVLGSEDRGSMPRQESWAGAPLLVLRETRAPAALLETHNGANYAHHSRFVRALARGELAAELVARAAKTIDWS